MNLHLFNFDKAAICVDALLVYFLVTKLSPPKYGQEVVSVGLSILDLEAEFVTNVVQVLMKSMLIVFYFFHVNIYLREYILLFDVDH